VVLLLHQQVLIIWLWQEQGAVDSKVAVGVLGVILVAHYP
jgi:hypothetical protein